MQGVLADADQIVFSHTVPATMASSSTWDPTNLVLSVSLYGQAPDARV